MKKRLVIALITFSASSLAQEEFFYKCDDGTKAHQYLDENGKAVMDFHGVKTTYRGINAANELSFVADGYSLSMKPLTETRFNMDLLGQKTRYATNCDEIQE
ncbi:hypothetical protein [Kluyvera georgiana]|uniref:hypothetical protein n=1 Tax=Kluyvera georgiana TaxID=73098 RepID=UPI0013D907FE|nr:hypothetical protein [Kluyvera georgiana]